MLPTLRAATRTVKHRGNGRTGRLRFSWRSANGHHALSGTMRTNKMEHGKRAFGQELDVEPGTFLFVKAGIKHFFFDIEEDLDVLVFFSTAASEESTGDSSP